MEENQITCVSCQTQNPNGTNFCIKCGKSLSGLHSCPLCGSMNPDGTKFCGNCGKNISAHEVKKTAKKIGKGCVYIFVAIGTILITLFFMTQCQSIGVFFIG